MTEPTPSAQPPGPTGPVVAQPPEQVPQQVPPQAPPSQGRDRSGRRSSRRRPLGRLNAPPPHVAPRVSAGGDWGPTPFDLPRRTGDKVPRIVAIVVLVLAAALLTGVGWLFYWLGH